MSIKKLSQNGRVGPRSSEAAAGKAEEEGDSMERIVDRRERRQTPPQPTEASVRSETVSKVVGISASPRKDGNSDLLLTETLAGAEAAGAEIEYLPLREANLRPCVGCNACYKTGRCVFAAEDDFGSIIETVLAADRLIFATPVYFMAVSAQAKLLIDRCQCLWAEKHVLKRTSRQRKSRDLRGMVIAVGGCASTKMFDCIRLTMKYFFDVLQMRHAYSLWVNGINERGEIADHPAALSEARRLGKRLVTGPRPTVGKSKRVLLIAGERPPTPRPS